MRRRMVLAIGAALAMATLPAAAAGVRTIATVTFDAWFDASWRVEAEDVLLVGVLPSLTMEARVSREDFEGSHAWEFGVGPVVNLTPNLYLVALYALGVDSDAAFSHEVDASLNHETATTAVSLGVKADLFPPTSSRPAWDFYVMPSLGGKFHPVEALGLFGKAFVAVDQDGKVSGSFWGEADWSVSRVVTLRAGGTIGGSGEFGWSAIAGINVAITPKVALKYTFRYLAEPVETLPGATVKKGVENALVLDVRF